MSRKSKTPHYKILDEDPSLQPYERDIVLRMSRYTEVRRALLGKELDISSFANGYLYYGIFRRKDGWIYREWAPGADEMHFFGDFNNWDPKATPMQRKPGGVWEVFLPGENALRHGQRVKVRVTRAGVSFDRIPLYIRKVEQDKATNGFCGIVWAPPHPFPWTDGGYRKHKVYTPFIYEAHVGMAQEKEGIGSYREFADFNLPRIAELGYNTVQLMAIMEHPYYGSFGYQVSNFFAASSWFGDPEDLKYLINRAHALGLSVLLDVVHSHAASNTAEGIACFDGTADQFFTQENHPAWGTKLFHYAKHEVLHFLLSNLKFWLEEYHFDGFRFDGVTSMIYHNHGLGEAFTGYDKYFSLNTNLDAITYLQLANELIHAVNPFALTIAEDMSGMPGMCVPIRSGGIGFDYRLSMGVPDFWIRLLKEYRDEDWDLFKMWYELTTRRPKEKNIGYCESHDQALVGDKTLIFRMADSEMYRGMEKSYHSPVIDRAIALHKIIRLVTLSLAGEGYLNFMGNEFGHPEWIDFPREGNGWSFKYARRQWSLADNGFLKYQWLQQFDMDMLRFAKKFRILRQQKPVNLWTDPQAKILAFEKTGLIFIFNFHACQSQQRFFVPISTAEDTRRYRVVFSTDRTCYGGDDRIDEQYVYPVTRSPERHSGFFVYIPCRTAMVLKASDSRET